MISFRLRSTKVDRKAASTSLWLSKTKLKPIRTQTAQVRTWQAKSTASLLRSGSKALTTFKRRRLQSTSMTFHPTSKATRVAVVPSKINKSSETRGKTLTTGHSLQESSKACSYQRSCSWKSFLRKLWQDRSSHWFRLWSSRSTCSCL